jgi:hypothetical protein
MAVAASESHGSHEGWMGRSCGSAELSPTGRAVTASAGVSGYAASPEWIEAAAFELLLFAVLAEGWERWGSAYAYVRRHYGALAERLGFATDRDGASMS